MLSDTMRASSYRSVKRLFGKHPEQAIATRLGMSRGYVQRRCWVVKLSAVIPEIEKWYLDGKLSDATLCVLSKAYNKGKKELVQEWKAFKGGKVPVGYYMRRPIGEIRRMIEETHNKKTREALEWVLYIHETI